VYLSILNGKVLFDELHQIDLQSLIIVYDSNSYTRYIILLELNMANFIIIIIILLFEVKVYSS